MQHPGTLNSLKYMIIAYAAEYRNSCECEILVSENRIVGDERSTKLLIRSDRLVIRKFPYGHEFWSPQ